mmetsp:Transcript_11205/g.31228  ORF Transcript_11205/g.31228 Transcript_11205/m.31228 type:complete len:206 (+) Transcript_11205:106-723(+)
MSYKMLVRFALLLAPLADARLRGFQAEQKPDATTPSVSEGPSAPKTPLEEAVACGQGPSADLAAETLGDGFDELALLQEEATPMEGMHKNTVQEWLQHWSDSIRGTRKTHISAEERVLHNETVAAQLAKIAAGACDDDPHWQDADGDGCEIYKFAIESGKTTREIACKGGGVQDAPASSNLRGKRVMVVSDATARVFCRATCGTC